jgi:hypothetical protein
MESPQQKGPARTIAAGWALPAAIHLALTKLAQRGDASKSALSQAHELVVLTTLPT